MSRFDFFRDPPPEFAIEIASGGIALARTKPPSVLQSVPLAPGVLATSPVRENILDVAAFTAAVKQLIPTGRGKRRAALILPDNSVRLAVLDFDRLPEKEAEVRSLINFRLRKSVPFDIDDAALSYFTQKDNKVIAVFTPMDIVARYEAPFRAAGIEPGLVTVSSLAMIDLLPATGSCLLAHRSPGALTLLAIGGGVITVARSVELTDDEEISSAIHTTLAFIEDQGGLRPEKLILAGFGELSGIDSEIETERLLDPWPGLAGYLASCAPAVRKKAAA